MDHAEELYKALRDISIGLVSQGLGRGLDAELKQALRVLTAYRASLITPLLRPPLTVVDVVVDSYEWTGVVHDVNEKEYNVYGHIAVKDGKPYADEMASEDLAISMEAIDLVELNEMIERKFDYEAHLDNKDNFSMGDDPEGRN